MIPLDEHAGTLPVGLSGTPFETVYKALRSVAASVWSVDPVVYRAGMAWGFYAQHDPRALENFRAVVAAALVSAQAPLVKDMQTVAELVEYLRLWREYLPTFPALSAIFRLFGAVVDVLPVTDAESQAILPAPDQRGVFYLRIEVGDMQRLLTLDEAVRLALNATPLGSHPLAYLSLESLIPAGAAVCSDAATTFVENGAICEPVPTPPTPDGILLGLKWRDGQGFTAESFSYSGSSNWWWAGFVDQAGKDEALALGCTTDTSSSCPCPLGVLCMDQQFDYEIIGLYSDLAGTIPVTDFDPSNFSLELSYPAWGAPASILCSATYPENIKAVTYRVKITPKS